MKSILDSSFVYTPSHATDLKAKFRRMRLAQSKANKEAAEKVILIATPTGNDHSTAASGDAPVVAGVHHRRQA